MISILLTHIANTCEHYLCAKNVAKCSMCDTSFNPHDSLLAFLPPFTEP